MTFADICVKFSTPYRVVRRILVVLKVSYWPELHSIVLKRQFRYGVLELVIPVTFHFSCFMNPRLDDNCNWCLGYMRHVFGEIYKLILICWRSGPVSILNTTWNKRRLKMLISPLGRNPEVIFHLITHSVFINQSKKSSFFLVPGLVEITFKKCVALGTRMVFMRLISGSCAPQASFPGIKHRNNVYVCLKQETTCLSKIIS